MSRPAVWMAASSWPVRLGRSGLMLTALLIAVAFVAADEKGAKDSAGKDVAEKSGEARLIEERNDLMRELVAGFQVESNAPGFPMQFEPEPIFRYTNPDGGAVAASVWKLGAEGRPRALLTVELNLTAIKRPAVMYEYSSLTATPFVLVSPRMRWSPSRTLYEFKPLPDMPPPEATPEATPARRLIQMRNAADRFACSEADSVKRNELRLLRQPVDRYKPGQAEGADGAIFLFVFGTNPEVVLFVESDGADWTYAVGRMTGMKTVSMKLDGKTVWEGAPLEKGNDSPYTGSAHAIVIPGFTAEGKKLTE